LSEAKTYRYKGTSRTDPPPYRPAGELEEWLARDPIHILRDRMFAAGELTEADFTALQQTAQQRVHAATLWALEQPYPSLDAVYGDIWAE